jgi:hypothetical protein
MVFLTEIKNGKSVQPCLSAAPNPAAPAAPAKIIRLCRHI